MSAPISIQPLGPNDFHPIAALEAHVFNDDPITIYAYGLNRASPAALQERANSLANPSSYPLVRMRKAITPSGQIVGFALWKFYTDLTRNPSAIGQEGFGSRDQGNDSGTATGMRIGKGSQESKWPEGANVQLCGAVFRMSDELCKLAMAGKKYAGMHFIILRA
jgi:hypothetical protein